MGNMSETVDETVDEVSCKQGIPEKMSGNGLVDICIERGLSLAKTFPVFIQRRGTDHSKQKGQLEYVDADTSLKKDVTDVKVV